MNRTFLQAILRSGFTLLLLLSVSFTVQAQQVPEAQVHDDLTFVLDTNDALSDTYTANVAYYASDVTDQASADQFAENFNRQHVDCSLDYPTLILTINLDTNNVLTSDWDVTEWNEYLKSNQ